MNTPEQPHLSHPSYRPDIDGLRAVVLQATQVAQASVEVAVAVVTPVVKILAAVVAVAPHPAVVEMAEVES
jgi:hypothetical protein